VQPVSFDTAVLRPLPRELQGGVCGQCDRAQSVWVLALAPEGSDQAPFVCSLCMLHKSRWAAEKQEQIKEFAKAVEYARNTRFERTDTGELLHIADADRLMFAIFMENRLHAVQARRPRE